jgi:hypothetical protein
MSLLDAGIEKHMLSQADKKIRLRVDRSGIDARLLREIGGYVGSSAPSATGNRHREASRRQSRQKRIQTPAKARPFGRGPRW